MKNRNFILVMALSIAATFFNSCTNESTKVAFQCPMECQVDTAYSQKGKCPICDMDLVKIEKLDSTKTVIINNAK